MKKMFLAAICSLGLSVPLVPAQTYLSSDTYSLTSNSASRVITVTNWPTAGSSTYEWCPEWILFNNRGATTGELLRVEHLRTSVSNIMETNGVFTVTNVLCVINSATAVSTNWIPATLWCLVPPRDQLRISTVCTNGEIILQRGSAR